MWITFSIRDPTLDNILFFKPTFLGKFYCKRHYTIDIFYAETLSFCTQTLFRKHFEYIFFIRITLQFF